MTSDVVVPNLDKSSDNLRDVFHSLFPVRRKPILHIVFSRLRRQKILESNIPAALRRWFDLLKPAGGIAFDMPAKPFGLSERIAAAAASQNVYRLYDSVADMPLKCRSLLQQAGFEAIEVHTEVVNTSPIELAEAIAFCDERLDHPAWPSLNEAPESVRHTARAILPRHYGARP